MLAQRNWLVVIAVAILTLGISSTASLAAGLIGNVARPVASGQFSVGLDYESFKQDIKEDIKYTCVAPCSPTTQTASDSEKLEFSAPSLVATYGIPGKPVEIGGLVGNVTVKPESGPSLTGSKAGGFIRYAREIPESVSYGLSLKYEGGSVSSSNFSGTYTATTLAFGVGKDITPLVRLFGGGFGNQISGTFDATTDRLHSLDASSGFPQGTIKSGRLTINEKSSLGGFLGIEFAPDKELAIGAEIHLVNESGFGAYVRFAF